jgi:hypothetical protein
MVAGVTRIMLCNLAFPTQVVLVPGLSLSADKGEVKRWQKTLKEITLNDKIT